MVEGVNYKGLSGKVKQGVGRGCLRGAEGSTYICAVGRGGSWPRGSPRK
jgi:hypothetical protein